MNKKTFVAVMMKKRGEPKASIGAPSRDMRAYPGKKKGKKRKVRKGY